MIKNRRTTYERVEKFISPIYFTDVNLFGQLYPNKHNLDLLEHFDSNQNRIPFAEAVTKEYLPAVVGQTFGPTWSTHWFKFTFSIPISWQGKEVHLRWNSGCEGLLYNEKGHPLQGFSGGVQERTDFIVTDCAAGEKNFQTFYMEIACNTMFGAGSATMISPPDPNKTFVLKMAEIAIYDREVYSLMISLECLLDMAKELSETNPRSFDALYTANEMVNVIQMHANSDGKKKAIEIAQNFFIQRNGATQHEIVAVGHCHIDSAWLWPYDETIRKCARSWSSTLRLMEKFPDFTFACSQAQQYEWVKIHYPSLFAEIRKAVCKGKFLPVGGTWVEMDGNLPSGESFIRQFLYGQKFFDQEFGITCKEFWLPDTFGYSAQLPQIMRMFNMDSFLTQKLSWNLVNKFPHHNFIWEGIDGSQVYAHFPPGESYEMEVKVKEAVKQVVNLEDKGRVSKSLMLFGHGDGGGGPNEDMLQRRLLLQDVDGIAKINLGKPVEVFDHLKERSDKLCKWVGELFLEMHNGTYTTQAQTKKLNRQCEFLLRELEIVTSVQIIMKPMDDSKVLLAKIESLWKKVLLNQFHDVLPGTSIGQVHDDACKLYTEVKIEAKNEIKKCFDGFLDRKKSRKHQFEFFNGLSWQRQEIVCLPYSQDLLVALEDKTKQIMKNSQFILIAVSVPSIGCSFITNSLLKLPENHYSVCKRLEDGIFVLSNEYLKAQISPNGEILNLYLIGEDRDIIPKNSGLKGNYLVMFDDIPLYWDAWDVMDYHLETRKPAISEMINEVCVVESGPLRISLEFKAKIGSQSTISQIISLDAMSPFLKFETFVNWHENHKFLKVEFPSNIVANNATYEIQFGHIQRPTHYNTSWDTARFEVCGHKWMDLSEHNFGLAILNNGKFGHSCKGNVMSLSLLRSTKSPDANADMGKHEFTYSLMPHKGTFQEARVINRAYELNSAISILKGCFTNVFDQSWFQVSSPAVIIETIKRMESENFPIQFVIRLYECYGSHVNCEITTKFNFKFIGLCNGLEHKLLAGGCDGSYPSNDDQSIKLNFKPFQILSIVVSFTA